MFSILISEKGGEQKRLEFDRPEITIGRVQGNDIVLPKGNVSKRHSRIVYKDGKFIIVDLKSTNGTYVNGRKITSPLVVKSTDKIYIGDFIMTIEEGVGSGEGDSAARAAPPPPPRGIRGGMAPATIPAIPAIRADASGGDVAAGAEDEAEEPAASAKSPPAEGEQVPSRPPLPPLPRPATRPPLTPDAGDARQTIANEIIRDAGALRAPIERPSPAPRPAREPEGGGSPLDRPVVAGDRISDKATMMASEGMAPRPTPAAPTPAAPPAASAPAASSASPLPSAQPASSGLGARPAAPAPAARAPLGTSPRPALRGTPGASGAPHRPSMAAIPIDDPQRRRRLEALTQVINKVIEQQGLQNATPEQFTEASARLQNAVGEIAEKIFPLPIGLESAGLAKEALAELLGAGPLDDFLADDSVHEVAVASHDRIYVDRGSGQSLSERVFSSPAGVLRAIHRLTMRAGHKPGVGADLIEVRIENGALLQAALPPRARVPSLVLRRARRTGGRLQDLVTQGVLSAAMSEFLEVCMRERRNLLVSGYGRGVMLGALGGATAAGARVVTVEPVSELDLSATHAAWIALFGRGSDMRSVIGHAVRMHPDHLIITDVRGPEALDVAAALCGGQGVVVGVDAASAREAVGRLESLSRLSTESPSRRALREELAQSLNLAIHVGRTAAGAYRVMEISEVTLADEGGIEMLPVFTFKPEGGDGQFVATGHVPAFAG